MMKERRQVDCLRWLGSQRVPVFLVGGSVRDRLLGRGGHDLDVVVSGSAIRLGRGLADRFGGAFYILDAERGAARALLPTEDAVPLTVDLTVMAGGDINSDLAVRDFTINAMAMSLALDGVGPLIDPHGGWSDLQTGCLRAVSSTSLRDDPIRVLRAVRLAHKFGLEIDPATQDQACDAVRLLGDISAERFRDEMCRILALSHASIPILRLNRWGVLKFLFETYGTSSAAGRDSAFPSRVEVAGAVLDAWECLLADVPSPAWCGSTPDVEVFWRAVARYRGLLADRLATVTSGDRTVSVLVKWVILLSFASEQSIVEDTLARLRFSRAEVRKGKTLAALFVTPGEWAGAGRVTPRQLYRFYRECRGCGPEALGLYLAARLAAPESVSGAGSPEEAVHVVDSALRAHFERFETIPVAPPQLVDGTTLIRQFDLQPVGTAYPNAAGASAGSPGGRGSAHGSGRTCLGAGVSGRQPCASRRLA